MRGILLRIAASAVAVLAAAGLAGAPAQAADWTPVHIGDTRLSTFVTASRADANVFMKPLGGEPDAGLQKWVFKFDANTGEGLIVNGSTSGCLAVPRVVIGDRRPLVQRPCDGQRTELWTVKEATDGGSLFVSVYSGRCMGYEPIFVGRFPQLLEFDCTGEAHQIFRTIRAV
jgi:hypothetical protein